MSILEHAINVYTLELERFLNFIGYLPIYPIFSLTLTHCFYVFSISLDVV